MKSESREQQGGRSALGGYTVAWRVEGCGELVAWMMMSSKISVLVELTVGLGVLFVAQEGDFVEYYSLTNCQWLPAKVIKVESFNSKMYAKGPVQIDLKPGVWMSFEACCKY